MKDVNVAKTIVKVGFKGVVNTVDEALLGMEYATRAYNFAFSKGMLTGDIGVEVAKNVAAIPNEFDELPYPIKNLFHYRLTKEGIRQDRLVAQLANGHIYFTSLFVKDGWHRVENLVLPGDLTAVNFNFEDDDILLLASKDDPLYVLKDETPYVCGNAPGFTSMDVMNERVFGSVGGTSQVWFSDDFNPINWKVGADEAGYIAMLDDCGDVIKVVSFKGYLYIFKEHGIYRLSAYSFQSEFKLVRAYMGMDRIVASSIAVCGDRILFYCGTQLLAFDGYSVEGVAKELPELSDRNDMEAAYLDSTYYLACRLDGAAERNAVIRYSFRDGSISVLYGYNVAMLRAVNVAGSVFCVPKDGKRVCRMSADGAVLSEPTRKRYFSPVNSMGSDGLKCVKSVSLVTDAPLTLVVVADGERTSIPVSASEFMQSVHVDKSGRLIGFELECDSAKCRVTPLTVRLEILSA